jgi:hypothetical protein
LEVPVEQVRREFVLCPLPPHAPQPDSQAERDRHAKLYWDSLTPAQEVWALRKMGFFEMGDLRKTRVATDA